MTADTRGERRRYTREVVMITIKDRRLETEYGTKLKGLAVSDRGPGDCRCGNTELTWGGGPAETIIDCPRCERSVVGSTVLEAIAKWDELRESDV